MGISFTQASTTTIVTHLTPKIVVIGHILKIKLHYQTVMVDKHNVLCNRHTGTTLQQVPKNRVSYVDIA